MSDSAKGAEQTWKRRARQAAAVLGLDEAKIVEATEAALISAVAERIATDEVTLTVEKWPQSREPMAIGTIGGGAGTDSPPRRTTMNLGDLLPER